MEKLLIYKDEDFENRIKNIVFSEQQQINFKLLNEALKPYDIDCFDADISKKLIALFTAEVRKILKGGTDAELLRFADKTEEYDKIMSLRRSMPDLLMYKEGAFDEFIEDKRVYTTDKNVIQLAKKIKKIAKELSDLGIEVYHIKQVLRRFEYNPQTGNLSLEALNRHLVATV